MALWPMLNKKLLLSLLVVGVIFGLTYAVYRHGYKNGSNEIRLKWEQDKATARAAHDKLMTQLINEQETHRLAQEKIANEALKTRQQYEAALVDQRAVHEQRLLQSSRRADVYRRQAEAGSSAQRDLASHAARLDQALEEGRGLVEELSTTLRLRDDQLKLLAKQIKNDRLIGQ